MQQGTSDSSKKKQRLKSMMSQVMTSFKKP